MKKKTIIYSTIVLALLILIYFLFIKDDAAAPTFTFAKLKKGDISNTITSTGTLDAVKTVDVGTQVSGVIDKIFVDFNSNVRKGQLLAILDTTNLALAVRDAKSNLEKAKSLYDQASAQYNRNQELYNKGFLSELDYISSKTSLESSLADYHSAQTSLQRSITNLKYAYIYSPINGTVINKNVEEGQTVASSFSSPTLFEIAENLSNMQILASVDESDIGQIKVGQEAKFSVEAFPDKEFPGKVVQIRLNSQVVSNVVNYTVVINADNKNNVLLPGMTATIDFYVEQKNDVLLVPNTALRFKPADDILAIYGSPQDSSSRRVPDSLRNKFRNSMGRGFGQNPGMGPSSNSNRARSFGRIWYLDGNNKLKMGMAVLGLSDGKNTEIVRSRNLKDGMTVITGVVASGDQNTNVNSQNQNFTRGLRRGF
jgi:HlyD family secretion protein